jgi:uncharacterized membrane protein
MLHESPPGNDAKRTGAVCHYSTSGNGLKIAAAALMARKRNLMRTDRLGYLAGGIALIVWALRRPSLPRAAAAGFGSWLLYQSYTGSNPMLKPLGLRVNPQPAEANVAETLVVEEAVTIARPREEVYAFWLRPENLPLASQGQTELTRECRGEELAWRTMRGEKLLHFGSLTLREAPGRRGTIVAARLEYVPTGGSLGAVLARVTGRSPQRLVAENLRRARALLETGEIPTTTGQPAGRR